MEILAAIFINAALFQMDPILIQSIIEVESNYNPKAVGTAGEVGLMQIYPKFHKEASFNIAKNITLGVKILDTYRKNCYYKYKDAWFICYNIGPNRAIKYPKRFKYYKKVMYAYEKISKDRRRFTRH